MSLLRTVLRATAVGALRSQTWAQERVADSDMTPIAQAVIGSKDKQGNPIAKPYILVYTDRDQMGGAIAKEVYKGEGRALQLALEIGVASAVRDPTGAISIQFSQSDSGFELTADVMDWQCTAALFGANKTNMQWGDLFKTMVAKVIKIDKMRGGQSAQGIRYAARRIVYTLQPQMDIAPGTVPPDTHWIKKFITLARANPFLNVADVANVLDQALTEMVAPGGEFPSWRIAQALLGMDTDAVKMVVPDGTPLPYDYDTQEAPPRPAPDTNEFVPPMQTIENTDDDDPNNIVRNPPITP